MNKQNDRSVGSRGPQSKGRNQSGIGNRGAEQGIVFDTGGIGKWIAPNGTRTKSN
jgi:hypothetical protein